MLIYTTEVLPEESLINRFLNKIIIDANNCWLWTGYIGNERYGRFKVKGKMLRAHRFSYQYYKGDIPPGLYVLHKCDIPKCVNPEHLFLGTPYDNMKDMRLKGREIKAKGINASKAKLSEEQVRDIRVKLSKGISLQELSKEFKVAYNAIRFIKLGLSWKHLK